MLRQNGLEFQELFVAKPHVFLSSVHPLAEKQVVSLEDLEEYPYLLSSRENIILFIFRRRF